MGGFGSGRWGASPTIEATASYSMLAGIVRGMRAGYVGSLTVTWSDGFQAAASFNGADPAGPYLELRHPRRADDESEVRYRIRLVRTHPPFGGDRWWFICPRLGRRSFKLFLPLGGHQFRSRAAYGLGYASQRGTALDRAHRRRVKIERTLWWDGEEPVRPPRMWRRTFEQRIVRLDEADGRIDAAWLPIACRLLKRISVREG